MRSPTWPGCPGTSAPDFTASRPGRICTATSASSVAVTDAGEVPTGVVPVAVTMLDAMPASTCGCVSSERAVAVTLCPGSSTPASPGQPVYCSEPGTSATPLSATPTPVRVTLPALVTT